MIALLRMCSEGKSDDLSRSVEYVCMFADTKFLCVDLPHKRKSYEEL